MRSGWGEKIKWALNLHYLFILKCIPHLPATLPVWQECWPLEVMLKRLLCNVASANGRYWKEIGCKRKWEARVCPLRSPCSAGCSSSSCFFPMTPTSSGQSHCGSSFTGGPYSRLWCTSSFLYLSWLGEIVASAATHPWLPYLSLLALSRPLT